MEAPVLEKRQHRRADVEGRVELRSFGVSSGQSATPVVGRADNVSLAGVYVRVPSPFPWLAGTAVSCAVNIPQDATKQFPFARLVATGRIVRVFPPKSPSGKSSASSSSREEGKDAGSTADVGVAIAFTSDVTALGTIGGY